jgi:hypothetical protein
MNLANHRQIDFEIQNTIDIKVTRDTKEFSKVTYIAITAATFCMMVYLTILLLS